MNDTINIFVGLLGALGGLAGVVSAFIALREWRQINKKIVMFKDSVAAFHVVPTWYTSRMMDDHWLFALQMSNGWLIAINKIIAVSSDGNWMDVELATIDEIMQIHDRYKPIIVAVSDDRRTASVKIAEVQVAFELQSS